MAENELLVTISGAALSLLFYENVRQYGEQMGFFLGNIHTYVTKNVTDADKQVESTKVHTDIQGILPCIPCNLMYGSTGRVDVKKLEEFVNNNRHKIVGWYRFRIDGPLHHTTRDKILHKELINFFCNSNNDISAHHFVSCLLSYSVTKSKGTHKFRHVFLRYMNRSYPSIPLKINNLGADASRHDGSDYKPTPIKSLRNETDCFAKYFETLNIDITRPSVMDSVPAILETAEKHLDFLVKNVSKTDSEIANLEQEANELMEKLKINEIQLLRLFEKKNTPGESHQENLTKHDNEHSKRVNLNNDDLQMKNIKFSTDSRKRNSSIQINNENYDSGIMKKVQPSKTYSQMTKKQPDTTDC